MHPSIVIPYGLMCAACIGLAFVGGAVAGNVGALIGMAAGIPVGVALIMGLFWLGDR